MQKNLGSFVKGVQQLGHQIKTNPGSFQVAKLRNICVILSFV